MSISQKDFVNSFIYVLYFCPTDKWCCEVRRLEMKDIYSFHGKEIHHETAEKALKGAKLSQVITWKAIEAWAKKDQGKKP